jgi:hypothetical protein
MLRPLNDMLDEELFLMLRHEQIYPVYTPLGSVQQSADTRSLLTLTLGLF